MVNVINLRKLVFLFPVAIVLGCIYVAKSPIFFENPSQISWAITFDLLVSTPLIYFLIIRKRNIPKTTLVPVFILGIVVASIILPSEHQFYLSLVKTWFLPVLEISIVTYVIVTIRKGYKAYKKNQDYTPDFFTAAKSASLSILPKPVSTPFATELSLFYYGFIAWKKKQLNEHDFTYHKTTSTRMTLGVFFFVIIIEAVAVHLLVQGYSNTLAWILTILSAYAGIQLLGTMRSLSKRPISIEGDSLVLRYSLMGEAKIPLEGIRISEQTSPIEESKDLIYLSPFKDMEGHNVLIETDQTQELVGFYGLKKKPFKAIAVYLDKPKAFIKKINELATPSAQSNP